MATTERFGSLWHPPHPIKILRVIRRHRVRIPRILIDEGNCCARIYRNPLRIKPNPFTSGCTLHLDNNLAFASSLSHTTTQK